MYPTAFKHFNSEGHQYFLDEISITFIDKANPSEPLTERITGGVPLRLLHHGVSMLRTVFELSLSSTFAFVCQYLFDI